MTLAQIKGSLATAFEYAWDNPTAEHDARNILASPKVGMWLGAEGLLIGLMCTLAFFLFPTEERGFRQLLAGMGSGPYLLTTALLTLTAFLTLIVPLRASGLLEGPRWRGYLDQLITTGMSPMRYYAGKWATSQPFFLALLGASLPFVVLFGLLGGADWSWVLLVYALLYLYCNLLLATCCGLGAMMHEVPALLVTLSIFIWAGIIACTPAPSALALLSPLRVLVQPMVDSLSGAKAGTFGSLYGPAILFGASIPWALYAATVWLALIAVLVVTCLLGPLHAFVPGLNNFGAVVLPGDRKKFFLRRFRPFVARRVELAFLFENRSQRLARWALPLRSLQQMVVLLVVLVATFGFLFHPELLANTPLEVVMVLHIMVVSICLLAALFVFSTGRVQALIHFELAGRRLPIVLLDALMFVIFLGALVVAHVLAFSTSWTDLGMSRSFRSGVQTPDQLFQLTSACLAVLIAVGCSAFLVSKVIGSSWLGKGWVFVGTVLYLFAIFVLPLFALGISSGFSRADLEVLRDLSTPMWVLGQFSPGTQLAVIMDGVPRSLAHRDLWLVKHGFWLWHPLLIAYLLVMVRMTHGSLFEEADMLNRDDLTPGKGAIHRCACSACGSFLSTPVRWTWWGGFLVASQLDYVRCLDCRVEYRASTGSPSVRTVTVFLLARVLLFGFLALGGIALAVGVFA